MQTISLKIPDNINARLESEAEERHSNKSEIIRKAITFYLDKKTKVCEPKSFYALSQDLCGKANGPSDLSTNPKHLEEYGE